MQLLGRILGLNKKSDQGTILGKDDNRYTFNKEEIDDEISPEKNMCVEFVPSENKKATNIHICETYIKENPKSMKIIVAAIIVVFVGFMAVFVSK